MACGLKCMRCDLKERLKDPEFRAGFEKQRRLIEIGVAVAKKMHRLGLSQAEVARRAGISRGALTRVFFGENYMEATLKKVLKALKMRMPPTCPHSRINGI